MTPLHVEQIKRARTLSPELAEKVRSMRMRAAMYEAECYRTDRDHGPNSVAGEFPRAPIQRSRVYTGRGDAGTYNHHSQLAKFQGRYYAAWSNGRVNEDMPGQGTMLAVSDDASSWSVVGCIVPCDAESGMLRWTTGLYADARQMVLYGVVHHATLDAEAPGMRRFEEGRSRLDAHVTEDGATWTAREGIAGDRTYLFEAPRPTREGMLLAGGTCQSQPVALLWDARDPAGAPEVVPMPQPSSGAAFPYGEASWCQAPDDTIVMWFRDEAQSLRLFVATSGDGGRTWTEPMVSDFPDSMSRVRAGELADGRCYLIGNAYPKLLDRMHLMIAFSDDGFTFDRMYTLLDDPTAQRAFGLLKVHGYQYPVAIEDEGRLLVAYSVNKEDIECAAVDVAGL